jgi:hypothetical protein
MGSVEVYRLGNRTWFLWDLLHPVLAWRVYRERPSYLSVMDEKAIGYSSFLDFGEDVKWIINLIQGTVILHHLHYERQEQHVLEPSLFQQRHQGTVLILGCGCQVTNRLAVKVRKMMFKANPLSLR